MHLLKSTPIKPEYALAGVRMVVGLMLLYHGLEIFQPAIMEKYLSWEVFAGSAGPFLAYFGKSLEIVSGIFLILGFMTRVAAVLCIATFFFIAFIIGEGRIWYEEQHPFMFILFGFLFFFVGPGKWSVDGQKNHTFNAFRTRSGS